MKPTTRGQGTRSATRLPAIVTDPVLEPEFAPVTKKGATSKATTESTLESESAPITKRKVTSNSSEPILELEHVPTKRKATSKTITEPTLETGPTPVTKRKATSKAAKESALKPGPAPTTKRKAALKTTTEPMFDSEPVPTTKRKTTSKTTVVEPKAKTAIVPGRRNNLKVANTTSTMPSPGIEDAVIEQDPTAIGSGSKGKGDTTEKKRVKKTVTFAAEVGADSLPAAQAPKRQTRSRVRSLCSN